MVKIEFGKVYRRLDSSVRFIAASALNLNPTIELVDTDPQYSGSDYLPKEVIVYVSNRNAKPTSSSEMTYSDKIKSGKGTPDNIVNDVHQISGASTWILFEKVNPLDELEGYTPDFFIRNSDDYNLIKADEVNL